MADLTGIILTHDEERHVAECIASLQQVTGDVLVFDSYSEDRTVDLARAAGARVVQHPFQDYGAQRNAALAAVDAEWVLFVDADERLTPDLAAEARAKLGQPERGWWVPRHNYIFGRLTDAAGWWPDYQLRLLHRASARYDPARPVHEVVLLDGEAGYLQHPLIHHNYDSAEQFHAKQRAYAEFEARRRCEEGLRPKFYSFLWLPFRHFVWRYFTERGWTLGLHGLRLSLLMAAYEFETWRRVEQMWRA